MISVSLSLALCLQSALVTANQVFQDLHDNEVVMLQVHTSLSQLPSLASLVSDGFDKDKETIELFHDAVHPDTSIDTGHHQQLLLPELEDTSYIFEHLSSQSCYVDGRVERGPVCRWGVTNPSFLISEHSNGVLTMFRKVALCGYNGVWFSGLVFGRAPLSLFRSAFQEESGWSTFEPVADPRFLNSSADVAMSGMKECRKADIEGEYNSSWAVAFGPEDPRLFAFQDKIYSIMVVREVLPVNSSDPCGHSVCLSENEMSQQVMEVVSTDPHIEFGPAIKLHFEGMGKVEKGFSMFSWQPPEGDEQLLAVQSVHPHTIMRTNLATGHMQTVSSLNSTALLDLAVSISIPPEHFHGGSGVVSIHRLGCQPYNMAVLHANRKKLRTEGGKNASYVHFPYKFRAEPPFEIMELGKRLPLVGNEDLCGWHDVSYVSSINLDDDDVVIGYGSGDRDSRMFRMPLDRFEDEFFGGDPCLPI